MAEVASAFVSLVPSAKGFKGKLEKEIGGDLDRAGTDGGKRYGNAATTSAGGMLKKAGPLLAAALTGVAAQKLVSFAASAIGSASDLSETINKANTIFGTNAAAIQKWAGDAAQNLGLSKQAALEAASGFGDMLSQIGFTGTEAAKLSTKIVDLSADLGSFNNLPTAEVADKISAAFRGEYDSLQALIPNINAARVEQEALAATGKKTTKELTAQEKATAVLAIVHKDGSRAAGDFAKTSDGLANQQKILKAELENVKTEIGTALLPVAQGFMSFVLREGVPALKNLIETVRENKEEIKQFALGFASMVLTIAGGLLRTAAVQLEFLAIVTEGMRKYVTFMLGFADKILATAELAFGWIPGIGDKITTARGHLDKFARTADEKLATAAGAFRKGADAARVAADSVAGLKARIDEIRSKTVVVRVDYQQVGSITNVPRSQRHAGGSVNRNNAYLVGEKRPEVFVPHEAGTILPRLSDLSAGAGGISGEDESVALLRALLAATQNAPREHRRLARQGGGHG